MQLYGKKSSFCILLSKEVMWNFEIKDETIDVTAKIYFIIKPAKKSTSNQSSFFYGHAENGQIHLLIWCVLLFVAIMCSYRSYHSLASSVVCVCSPCSNDSFLLMSRWLPSCHKGVWQSPQIRCYRPPGLHINTDTNHKNYIYFQ